MMGSQSRPTSKSTRGPALLLRSARLTGKLVKVANLLSVAAVVSMPAAPGPLPVGISRSPTASANQARVAAPAPPHTALPQPELAPAPAAQTDVTETPTPTPSETPTLQSGPTLTLTPIPTDTPLDTETPTPTTLPTESPSETIAPTATESVTATPSETATATASPTVFSPPEASPTPSGPSSLLLHFDLTRTGSETGESLQLHWWIDGWELIRDRGGLELVFYFSPGLIPQEAQNVVVDQGDLTLRFPLASADGDLLFEIQADAYMPYRIEGQIAAEGLPLATAAKIGGIPDQVPPSVKNAEPALFPIGWGGEVTGTFSGDWTGAAGSESWVGADSVGGDQLTQGYIEFVIQNIKDRDPIEVCSRGALPGSLVPGLTSEIARVSPTYDTGEAFSFEGWDCIRQALQVQSPTGTFQIGHFPGSAGVFRRVSGLTKNEAAAVHYSWQVWVKSIGETAFPMPTSASAKLAVPSGPMSLQASGGVVYLATKGQVGRSRDFYSSGSPHWENVKGPLPIPDGGRGGLIEFALDPFNTTNRAWAAIGNPDTWNLGGLWRTDDLDATSPTWNQLLTETQLMAALGGTSAWVKRVIPSPLQPGLVFIAVGGNGGLSVGRSEDYGGTWTWAKALGNTQDRSTGMAVSYHDPNKVWVSVGQPNSRILASTDGGRTFGLLHGFGTAWWYSYDIYLPRAANPNDQIMFVVQDNPSGGLTELYKSTDGGASFAIDTLGGYRPYFLYHTSGSFYPDRQKAFYTNSPCNGPWGFIDSTDGGQSWTLRYWTSDWRSVAWMWPNDSNRLLTARGKNGYVSPGGPVALYSSDGGTTWQDKTGDWFTSIGSLYDAGAGSCGGTSPVTILDTQLAAATVPDAAVMSGLETKTGASDSRGGTLSSFCCVKGGAGDPIDTRTGGLDYSLSDLSIPTSAGPLLFQRSYSSSATGLYAGTLGYGWTSNHDIRLVFPGDPGGQTGHVFFKATSANQFDFLDNGNQTYSSTPGVLATLTRNPGPPVTYAVIDPTQGRYTFSDTGKLQSWADAQGHVWTYTYDGNGRLDRVSGDNGQRYLQYGYDAQNRITTVADQTARGITIGYDANGDLHTVLDVNGGTWTYTYDGSHRLRLVQDPDSITVTHTEYDAQGRAFEQYDPSGTLILQITYNADGTTSVAEFGTTLTHTYDSRNTLTGETDALSQSIDKTYDGNFRPATITDQNENTTHLSWSTSGANLTKVVDAASGQVDLTYDGLNNLRQVVDARRNTTTYSYNEADPDPSKRTLLNSTTDALGITTSFTYTTTADAPQPVGLLKSITDPLLHTTSFVYDEHGQRISSTDALNRTSNYTYDSLGRLKVVEDPSHHMAWTCYDPSGRVIRRVANATGDGGTPQTDPCDAANYQPSSNPALDRITSTVFDAAGRVIAIIDPAGSITRTYYDSHARPYAVVQNLKGRDYTYPDPPLRDSSDPDQNLRTDTIYDASGNVIATQDALGIITRTYYDAVLRPSIVIQNFVSPNITDPPPSWDPAHPDWNVRTETSYDDAGHVIAIKDNAGRITRTYYDVLGRPTTTVRNLTNWDPSNPNPPARVPSNSTENLRTDMTYDANGNVVSTTDPLGIMTCTWFDVLNRPQKTIKNLNPTAACGGSAPAYDSQFPDQNVWTTYTYDDAGNQVAVTDTLENITRTYYDADNRPYLVVQNLFPKEIFAQQIPPYDPAHPDRNIHTETVFDEMGRAIGTVDTLNRKARTYYDELGRPTVVVRNLIGKEITDPLPPPPYNQDFPDQNVATTTVYDAQGNAIATVTNGGVITRTYFDDVHRAVAVARNLVGQTIEYHDPPTYNSTYPDQNVVSQTEYDLSGATVRTIDAANTTMNTCYDGLRRVVKTVENPSVGDPCGSYSPSSDADRDITTTTTYDRSGTRHSVTDPNGKTTTFGYDPLDRQTAETDPLSHSTAYGYDANGNRVSMTDARNVVTSYENDALGRLTAVVEDYKPGFNPTEDINVRTEYTYDGLGNRKTIKDARTYVTNFGYDALGRLTTETDPLSHVTTYSYDGLGNRISLLDANGATTTFSYDDLNRPTGIDYPAPDSDVTFTYDVAGNRQTMVDGLGTTQWVYDDLNRATSISNPVGGTIGYGYDGAGHRISLTYPDTKQVGYSYDLAGRLHIVTDWDSLQTTYTYDKGSRPGTTTLPNGLVSTYVFDDAGRLNSISHVRSSTTLASYTYGVDEVGNRTSATETMRQPAVAATQLWVSDTGNNRRTLFDIATITNGENAVDLVGQYDSGGSILYTKNGANDGPNVRGLNTPYDSVVDTANHRLFVSDTSNNRVLMFNLDASNQLVDRVADAVLGQPNMTSRAASLTATGENTPRGLALDPATNRLFVADAGYHRILVYDVVSVTNGESAANVLGQTTFTAGSSGLAQNRLNGPRGLAFAGGLLYVGDTTNNRVMVFDVTSITNGENAVHVLGQAIFTTNTAATTQTGLSSPRGTALDSLNRLFVADTTNNRVMVFDVTTITDGEAAINVLGQATFTTSTAATSQTGLRAPEDAFADSSNRLFVGDSSNHRVMVFDVATVTDGEPAVNVLGQTSFTAGSSSVSQSRLNTPYGVSVQASLLYVADANNHRLMVFDVASITNGENAVNLAGQLDGSLSPSYTKNGPNDGPNLMGVNLSGAFADQVIDFAGHRLFASDPTNNRVLVFDIDANNQLLDRTPDAVLGQTDFYSRTAAAAQNRFSSPRGLALDPASRRLFVADYSNSRVLVFDVTTVANGQNAINVLGQTTFTAGTGATAQNRLKNPAGVALDTSRTWLFVGDYNNNRVMVFDVASITNGENAINVLGQTTFTTATVATSQSGLRYPTGVSVDGGTGRLFVADTNNHRVMLFDVASITNGENAVNVLGQPDFVTATAATTQAGMRSPQGVALDPASNRLFVGDTANHRVTVFDVASVTNGENAVNVLGQTNFTSGSAATTQSRMSSPIGILPVATAVDVTTTISYTYDPLYRLKNADYNTGPYFHYIYDATGNRLTQTTQVGSNTYVYDNANRLTSVDGVTYTWDNNGNLLSDGASTYTYDHANRLATAVQGPNSYAFAYNGLGVRLRQTVNAAPINYAVDTNTDLAVVLADGTNTYLYGPAVGSVQGARVGERQTGGWVYPLGDALASTRQLVDPAGGITLAQSYEPFGSVSTMTGGGSTVFQFTGEQRDSTSLTYLRSRYYSSAVGRFLTADPILRVLAYPGIANLWAYATDNPVNFTDPQGLWRWALTGSLYHLLVENWYEGTPGGIGNPLVQLEYPVPGTPYRRPDMFNVATGDIYEIEPFFPWTLSSGQRQVLEYQGLLSAATSAQLLAGKYAFVLPYNWNATQFHVGSRLGWPGRLRMPYPPAPAFDLVADYAAGGVVAYWLEPNALFYALVTSGIAARVTNMRLVRPPDWSPRSAFEGGYVVNLERACKIALVVAGGTLIAYTLVNDATVIGLADDVITLPTGLLFIYIGTRQAFFAPVEQSEPGPIQ